MYRRMKKLTGMQFGNLTVIEPVGLTKNGQVRWRCSCKCGGESFPRGDYLSSGSAQTCGCREIRNSKVRARSFKTCWRCGRSKPLDNFHKPPSLGVARSAMCKECHKHDQNHRYKNNPDFAERTKERVITTARRVRREVIRHYGGSCGCCSESRIEFLSMDHVNNDGATHRRTDRGSAQIYSWLKKNDFPTTGFAILCFNCNLAKHHTKDNCPHHEPSWASASWGGGPIACDIV